MPYSEYKYRNDCKSNTNWLNKYIIWNMDDENIDDGLGDEPGTKKPNSMAMKKL